MTNQPPKKKMARWKRVLLIIACVLLALLLLVFSVFGILWLKGRNALLGGNNVTLEPPTGYDVTIDDDQTVIYNGERYQYNPNMTTVLCMGTDKNATESERDQANGQADAIFLVAIDTASGKTTVIAISRDIMAEISIYDQKGNFVGTEVHQICLAYAYGDSPEAGCNNMVTAVSRLLCGVPINTYFSIDWSTVPLLTKSVGGVTVPAYDKEWNPIGGTVTLTGDDSVDYLRGRRHDVVTANNNRMERQASYLKSFAAKAIEQSRANPSFPLKLFDMLGSHSTSNIDASRITYLSTVFLDNGAQMNFRSVAGEITMGDDFAEMRVDQQALFELVLEVFFQKVQ